MAKKPKSYCCEAKIVKRHTQLEHDDPYNIYEEWYVCKDCGNEVQSSGQPIDYKYTTRDIGR